MIEEGIYLERVDVGLDWPEYVFLTRDSHDGTGELSKVVEVWADCPTQWNAQDANGKRVPGVLWTPRDSEAEGLLGRYSLAAAAKFFRTLPETDHECIRAPTR